MRWPGPFLAATAIAFVPAPATAATTYQDTFRGVEYAATATSGSFAAAAAGDLPGPVRATVVHTGLSPHARITGGDFSLTTRLDDAPRRLTGNFTGGTVRLRDPGGGCADQTYDVTAALSIARFGDGVVNGTLTHHRALVLQRCVPVSASIQGVLTATRS